MNCEIFRELLGSYVDEALDEERRQQFRRHLRECPACRELAITEDPSLFLTGTPPAQAPPEAVEACVAAVAARIRQDRLQRRLHRHRRPWLTVAAASIMIVGGGLLWRTMTGGAGAPQAAVEVAGDLDLKALPPTVEIETRSEDVRVYRFATENDADTAVYFVVDPALEL